MKNVIKLIAGLALIAYLIYAVITWSPSQSDVQCTRVEICIEDSLQADFVTRASIESLLAQRGQHPMGRSMKDIHVNEVERVLKEHPFVLDASCYKTPGGVVGINVRQHLPVMRILTDRANYFIDEQGNRMKGGDVPANVVVATGNITEAYAKEKLAPIGSYLLAHEFWNKQVEQIQVLPSGDLELAVRVGNHIIELGAPDDIEKKLDNVRLFYDKVIQKVGWNKYSRIIVAYDGQVVGRRAGK